MQHNILFRFAGLNFELTGSNGLWTKIATIRRKYVVFSKMFVLRSMGKELVPSSLHVHSMRGSSIRGGGLYKPKAFAQVLKFKLYTSGPGCSKLTTSLVNVSLKFQMLISQICQYFLLKKNMRSFCTAKASLIFFNKKYQCSWLLSRETLNELTS